MNALPKTSGFSVICINTFKIVLHTGDKSDIT